MIPNILYAVLIFHVIRRCTFAAIGLGSYRSEVTFW